MEYEIQKFSKRVVKPLYRGEEPDIWIDIFMWLLIILWFVLIVLFLI